MVRITEELALSPEHLDLYHANDPLLGHLPVLLFHGPVTTANITQNNSRVQLHVFSPAGFQSYPRLTIAPNSSFYSVVNRLPREDQSDEICRALAFGLFRYFTELPEVVKGHLRAQYPTTRARRPGSAPTLFGEQHAADLAKAMTKSDNAPAVINDLQSSLRTQHISNVDIDLVLPPGSIAPLQAADLEAPPESEDEILDPTLKQYGMYKPLVKLWGEPVFLPTSRLRRAPSKPTSLNRSKSFLEGQKKELRMKLNELLETEDRYVTKLNELAVHIAPEFIAQSMDRSTSSTQPSVADIEKLFPKSANDILQLNASFLQHLRNIVNETSDDANEDMDVNDGPLPLRLGPTPKAKDPTGALRVAKLFLEWFPRFTESYQDYIRASQAFPQLLTKVYNTQSSFKQSVATRSEQVVRSILIEPVQRLPRYSLLIDQMVGCLPITHPALQLMLRARDIITNICSMDEPLDKPHVTNRLRNMVESWPVDLEPQGRLTHAADFLELSAPCTIDLDTYSDARPGVLLLFADCLVILRKLTDQCRSGRELLREVERPSPAGLLASMTNAASGTPSHEYTFAGWLHLADARFTESADGRTVWLTYLKDLKGVHAGGPSMNKTPTSRCLLLQEAFEGKAAKWSEDVTKTRIEGRFSEKERESHGWTLRMAKSPESQLGLHAAVFEEAAEQLIEGRREPAAIRIVVDTNKGTKGAPVGHYGVEIVVEVRAGDLKRLQINTRGLEKQHSDIVELEDFLPTLSRRITQLLSAQFSVANIRLAPALVSYYTKIIRSLTWTAKVERPKSFLPSSPVKLFSSFLTGGTPTSATESPAKPVKSPFFNPPSLSRSTSSKEVSVLNNSVRSRDDAASINIGAEEAMLENPLFRLEQIFTGYVASLQSLKGHFIGRSLLSRGMTDELSVNLLYNRLNESPLDLQAATGMTPDVVFSAFEKFVRIAWREQIGPIMTSETLDLMQDRAGRKAPGNFGDFVNYLMADIAPQSRRAFTALIKLLADLLEGCSNDSDRGALTLAFAELLIDDGTASSYVNLLDRFVEDCDRIFEEPGLAPITPAGANSGYGSVNSAHRSIKSNTGSFTSNTSSIRRKLGVGNLFKSDKQTDVERPSVWRSLSKHGRGGVSETGSLGRNTVGRTRSVDIGLYAPNALRRPASRDRPPVAGAFDALENRPDSSGRPMSSHRLETIGEPASSNTAPQTPSIRRPRRSSMSDLKTLLEATSLREDSPMPLTTTRKTSGKMNGMPRTSMPSRIPMSPQSAGSRPPQHKENVPEAKKVPAQDSSKPPSVFSALRKSSPLPLQDISITPNRPLPPMSREASKPNSATKSGRTSIPMLKPSRLPAATPAKSVRPSITPAKSLLPAATRLQPTTSKHRIQSPAKLRERLQGDKEALEEADAAIKADIAAVSTKLAGLAMTLPSSHTQDLTQLSASIRNLEDRIPARLQDLTTRQTSLQADLDANLRASEKKVKEVDLLYSQAMAENELIYERFHNELGNMVKKLKAKGSRGEELADLINRCKEGSEEVAKCKGENARLRREIAGLRALIKGGGEKV